MGNTVDTVYDESDQFNTQGIINYIAYYNTYLKIVNNTQLKIINTEAYNIDNFDWHVDYHPANKLRGLTILPTKSHTSRLVVYKPASGGWPFTLKLTFEGNYIVRTRIRQGEVYKFYDKGPTEKEKLRDDWLIESPFEVQIVLRDYYTTVLIINQSKDENLDRISKKHNKNGEAALRSNRAKAAIAYFKDAIKNSTSDGTRKTAQQNLLKSYAVLGKQQLDEGLKKEAAEKTTEAQKAFEEAKRNLELAYKVKSETNRKRLEFVTLKIKGNELFNAAVKTEQEASLLFKAALDSDNVQAAAVSEKYAEAESLYKEALENFDEAHNLGVANLQQSKQIAQEQVAELEQLVDNIDNIILQEKYKKMEMAESEKEQQFTSEQYVEQTEVIT